MDMLVISPIDVVENPATRYELPQEGISNLGYIVRRMHKTSSLNRVSELINVENFAQTLYQIALYVTSASSSFGKLYYQPDENQVGETVTEKDPATGAIISATFTQSEEMRQYQYMVQMPNGDIISGADNESESNISFRGWSFPSTSKYQFTSADESYHAEFEGEIMREVVPRVSGPWHGRAHGQMTMTDNHGNSGSVTLNTSAEMVVTIHCSCGNQVLHKETKIV